MCYYKQGTLFDNRASNWQRDGRHSAPVMTRRAEIMITAASWEVRQCSVLQIMTPSRPSGALQRKLCAAAGTMSTDR